MRVGVSVGAGVSVAVGVGVSVSVGAGVCVAVGVGGGVRVGVLVAAGICVAVDVLLGKGVLIGVRVPDDSGVSVGTVPVGLQPTSRIAGIRQRLMIVCVLTVPSSSWYVIRAGRLRRGLWRGHLV